MNYITITKHSDFQELLDIDILITGDLTKQKKELEYNTWCISFDPNFIQQISLQDLQQFMDTLLQKRIKQLQQKNNRTPVTFYVWFEEISLQLCFDFLSGQNIKLPFGRKLNILPSINPVLINFLTEAQRISTDGNIDDFVFLNPGDPGWDEFDNEDDEPTWIQDVYVTTLPQPSLSTFLKNLIS